MLISKYAKAGLHSIVYELARHLSNTNFKKHEFYSCGEDLPYLVLAMTNSLFVIETR